jgi:hypothetical protein
MTGGHERGQQILIGSAAVLWSTLFAGAVVEAVTETQWPGAGVGQLVLGGAVVITERAWHTGSRPAPPTDPARQQVVADRAFHLARRLAWEYQGGRWRHMERHYRKSA